MESPVERVENASSTYQAPGRVKRMAESAPEKDEKFTKVLREKMDKDQHHKKQKRKQPEAAVELHLSGGEPGTDEPVVDSQSDESAEADSEEKPQESQADHLDLTA